MDPKHLGPLFCFDSGEGGRPLNVFFFFFFFQIFLISFNFELKKKHMQNGVVLVVLTAAITKL